MGSERLVLFRVVSSRTSIYSTSDAAARAKSVYNSNMSKHWTIRLRCKSVTDRTNKHVGRSHGDILLNAHPMTECACVEQKLQLLLQLLLVRLVVSEINSNVMSGFFAGKSVNDVNLWLRQKKIDSDVIEAFKRE